jgi:predicted MFS family arabinose efflux permease
VRIHPLKKQSKIYVFASVGGFIALSEAIYDLVFANLAYSIAGTPSAVTTTYAVGYAAEILVTLLGAGFIDRFNKWKLFIGTQLINIVVFSIATLVLSKPNSSVATVWGFAFFVDLIHQYSRLIMFALIPFLFDREDIPRLNGFLSTLNGVARSVGPAIGAIAILQIGLSMSLAVSIAFMAIALLLAFSLYSSGGVQSAGIESRDAEGSSFAQRFQDSVTGASRAAFSLFRSRQWRSFLGAYSTCVLVISVLALLWIPFLRDFHGFTSEQTGYLFAVGACGSIFGGLTGKRYSTENSLSVLILSAHFVMLFGVIITLVSRGSITLVGAGLFAFQFGATVYFRTTASVIQLSVPKDIIGSWYGAIDFTSRFAGLAGILIAGWFYDHMGAYWVYSFLLVLLAASSFNGLSARLPSLSPRRPH